MIRSPLKLIGARPHLFSRAALPRRILLLLLPTHAPIRASDLSQGDAAVEDLRQSYAG
jgi:hypothetical protein